MAACRFEIPVFDNYVPMLDKARNAVLKQGGTFEGNENEGYFSVSAFGYKAAGSYVVDGNNIIITVTEKPFLISCNTLENLLKKYMNE